MKLETRQVNSGNEYSFSEDILATVLDDPHTVHTLLSSPSFETCFSAM